MTVLSKFQRGFSLVEAIITIVIGGIMVAAVVMFLQLPFQNYQSASRHAQLSDAVDTAVRRMGRDLRVALPNSVRVSAGANCIEMLPTITGGRYRSDYDSAKPGPPPNNGTILDFVNGSAAFDMFGQFSGIASQTPAPGNLVVVSNLGIASPAANAYALNNTAAIKGFIFPDPNEAGETLITLQALTLFPIASPGNRFQIIGAANTGALSYVCAGAGVDALGNGTGTLSRVSVYPIVPAQACPPAAGTSTLIANNVSACSIQYTPGGPTDVTARNGLVAVSLQLQQAFDAVNIYDEIHISNSP